MPTIGMFYGIIVRMLAMDTQQHHLPHIYEEYQGRQAVNGYRMGISSMAKSPPASCGWGRRGSRFTRKNCSPIGHWR